MNEARKRALEYRKILGDPQTREAVMEKIQSDEATKRLFEEFPEDLQEEIIAFAMGNWGLKVTYDPIFKFIFNPAIRPERLSELLSLILGEKVEVIAAMPSESDRITDKGSLLIMDILVKLKSGALANVEIQKIGYTFPGQRCACYSSDLLMRELVRVKQEMGEKFSYKYMKKVYSIILIEKSSSEYHQIPDVYIHRGKQIFDTGLELDMLQEYVIIPLDIFKEIHHNELSKLDAWLYFLSSDDPKDISRVIEVYPQFKELYNELLMLRYQLKELIKMYDAYREALRIADENTVKYMIEEQAKELKEKDAKLEEQNVELKEKDAKIEEQDAKLEEQSAEIKRLKKAASGKIVEYRKELINDELNEYKKCYSNR